MEFKKFGQDEVGCYADGARGRYIGVVVIEMAEDHGFDIADLLEEFAQVCDCEQADAPTWEEFLADHEFYHDTWDAAENYLNGLTEEGYYFGTSEGGGDWGLWEVDVEPCELCPEDYMDA
jgi:hypothetical protein